MLVRHVLRKCQNGYPLPVKALGALTCVIRRSRKTTSAEGTKPPGKNWPQGFYKRNPQLKSRRMRAIPWDRHDHSIYAKVTEWFSIIGKELASPAILDENVYNMDETGVRLGNLGSLKVLVSRDELQNYRGAGSQRTLITAVECISATGRCLDPLVIWPAKSHRSNWTTHPTPGWHFACSETGYTNNVINLYWMQHVFDPQTKPTANGKRRILINDGQLSHESLDVMTFCFENNIIFCRLSSHTSHKLQPCDLAVFGPLKTAYREQVERLFRGGAGMVDKQHFTLLYSRARETPLTARNIRSGWSKAGLSPLNPERVLATLNQPASAPGPVCHETTFAPIPSIVPLSTPTDADGLHRMRGTLDKILDTLSDDEFRPHIQKIMHAAEQSFANCALLTEHNSSLFQQNSRKVIRKAARATVPGPAKIMSYEDIDRARRIREEVEAKSQKDKQTRGRTRKRGKASTSNPEDPTETTTDEETQGSSTRRVHVAATQCVEGWTAPCPGRAPVARMWYISNCIDISSDLSQLRLLRAADRTRAGVVVQ